MSLSAQSAISAHYRALVTTHGAAPEGTQMSAEGQRFRFEKLMEIGDLSGLEVLDLGCGTGAFYPFLAGRFPTMKYLGVDILPEMVSVAARTWPGARFRSCDPLAADDAELGRYDVALLSGIFNNARPDSDEFLRAIIRRAFRAARHAVGFNFISTVVNRRDPEMAYHDPAEILRFCIDELSPRVTLQHHYQRCDVSVFIYR